MSAHRREFMNVCTQGVGDAPAYCTCGWEQMQKVFTEEEMSSDRVSESKLVALRLLTADECLHKLPERNVKERFASACVGDHDELQDYCSCAWTSLRKQLSLADLAGNSDTPKSRIAAAKKETARTCGDKMPEDIPRQDFMKGCTRGDTSLGPFCGCAWKAVRAELTPAEIAAAGEDDIAPLQEKINEACGDLRPTI